VVGRTNSETFGGGTWGEKEISISRENSLMNMAGPKSLSTRIKTRYERDGLPSILRSGIKLPIYLVNSTIQETKTKYIFRRIEARIANRNQLHNTSNRIPYGDEESVEISSHRSDLPETFQSILGSFHRPQPKVAEITGGKLLWEGSPALSKNNDIILETAENEKTILQHRIRTALSERDFNTVLSDIQGKIKRKFDWSTPLFLLVRHPSTNYYHWVVEYLPKLVAFDKYNRQNRETATLLIEKDAPDWVTESIKLLGYSENEWVTWDNKSAQIKHLLVPQHNSRTRDTPDLPSPNECEFVKTRANSNLQTNSSSSRYLFISRQGAEDRRIQNFREVQSLVKQYGFDTCVLEEMTFVEQVELFSQADVVLGTHGAGLTNIIFGDNLCVIELFPDTDIREHYFYLSNISNHDYYFLNNETVGLDIVVDTESLRNLLDNIME